MKRLFFGMLGIASLLLQPPSRVGAQRLTDRCFRATVPNRLDSSGHVVGKLWTAQKFFGDFNARIEYLLEPSFSEFLGCRVYRGATDTAYVLEIKRRDNFQEIAQKSRKARQEGTYTDECVNRLLSFPIDTWSLPISERLADRLYAATMAAIFTDVEPDPITDTGEMTVICDGSEATFQCVPDDDADRVRRLTYHEPEGKQGEVSDLFLAIIADVRARTFDEAKYLGMLTEIVPEKEN